MKKLFILIIFFPLIVFSQGRIILNGGTITIQNGAKLVIQNSQPNAITVLDSSSGILINDAESRLRWHIGETSGNYFIPFKYENNLIPLSFITSEASGKGYFDLSTYHVPTWKNSDHLPPGIDHVNHNGADNSEHLLDRFWLIHAQGYTIKPVLSDLSFGYTDEEWNVSENKISESMLKAQRWNTDLNVWSEYPPSGNANAANNQVNISSLPAKDFFEWWTLVDADYPLNEEQQQTSKMLERRENISNSSAIRLYPNPVIQSLTVDLGGSGAKELHIIDVTGKKIHQQLIINDIQTINLSFLAGGTYFIQLSKGNAKWTYKIVKQ